MNFTNINKSNVLNIKSFSEIKINKNTLIICDIDDTLLYTNKSTNLLTILCGDCLPVVYHTDNLGFQELLKNIKNTESHICFLTARVNSTNCKKITKIDFNDIGLNYDDYNVYHCGPIPKGEYIKKNISYDEYDEVIFIDDLDKNINNVIVNFGLKIKCYKFFL